MHICVLTDIANISYCWALVYVYFLLPLKESRLHLIPKSFILYKNASLAQRLEHRICNARVVGSIPTGGSTYMGSYYVGNAFYVSVA